MQRIWNNYPSLIAESPCQALEKLLVVAERRRNLHAVHVARCEAVEECLLFINGITESPSYEVSQPHADCISVRSGRKRQCRNNPDHRRREILAIAATAEAEDVCVHARAAERLTDRIDDEHVNVIQRQPRKIMFVTLDQLGLASQDVARPQRMQLSRL